MYNDIDLQLHFRHDETEEEKTVSYDDYDNELIDHYLVGHDLTTDFEEDIIASLFDTLIEKELYHNPSPDFDFIETVIDHSESLEESELMSIIAYHDAYTISSLKEWYDVDSNSFMIITNYESIADYAKDITLQSEPEITSFAQFIDWEEYANHIGLNVTKARYLGETFLYQII